MPNAKPEDFQELQTLMLKQLAGERKLAAVRTLSFGLLWCLGEKIPDGIIEDVLLLLRFEHNRRMAEGTEP
jgi:hypothetical protein